jgi:hypothetical protein
MNIRSSLIRAVTAAALVAGAAVGLTAPRAGAAGDADCTGQKSCITQAYSVQGQLYVKATFKAGWGHLEIKPEGYPKYVIPFVQNTKAVALNNGIAPFGTYITLRSTNQLCIPGKSCDKESWASVYNGAPGTTWAHYPIVGLPMYVKAGYRADGPLGVCVAKGVNNTQVGNFVASKNVCSFTDGTYFYIRYDGEYLAGMNGKTWKTVSYGQSKIPAKAVVAGRESGKGNVYICRMKVEGALVPGGLRADGCSVWFAGAAHKATAQYEVLVSA